MVQSVLEGKQMLLKSLYLKIEKFMRFLLIESQMMIDQSMIRSHIDSDRTVPWTVSLFRLDHNLLINLYFIMTRQQQHKTPFLQDWDPENSISL